VCGLLGLLVLLQLDRFVRAQDPNDAFKWDVKCVQRGCMLSLDVLHGAAGEKSPPDPQDTRQYISLMVAVDRATRQPAYMAFHFPPDADQKQGFYVGFAKDERVNKEWHVKPDKSAMYDLGFDSCDKDSCVARMREGKVADGKGGFISLFDKFESEDHLWLMYTRAGQPIRTLIPLGPFKSTYQHVLMTELAPQR
jgi:hypothetical protein